MAFQEIGAGDYVAWKNLNEGDIGVEGWFLQKTESRYVYGNFVFLTAEGKKVTVNGCGFVAKAMEDVTPGDYCRMIYEGQTIMGPKSRNPGKPSHKVRVEVDPDRRGIVQNGLFVGMAPRPEAPQAVANAAPVTHQAAPVPPTIPTPRPAAPAVPTPTETANNDGDDFW